jgi:hypothetical protein
MCCFVIDLVIFCGKQAQGFITERERERERETKTTRRGEQQRVIHSKISDELRSEWKWC